MEKRTDTISILNRSPPMGDANAVFDVWFEVSKERINGSKQEEREMLSMLCYLKVKCK